MEASVHSKASGSDDEPLVPDDFDDQFYKDLLARIPEVYFSILILFRNLINVLLLFRLDNESFTSKGYPR